MSETTTKSAQFWVRTMRAQARRAAKAKVWSNRMRLWLSMRDRHAAGTEGWADCDNTARVCGARASAFIALRDGDIRRARACRAVERRFA